MNRGRPGGALRRHVAADADGEAGPPARHLDQVGHDAFEAAAPALVGTLSVVPAPQLHRPELTSNMQGNQLGRHVWRQAQPVRHHRGVFAVALVAASARSRGVMARITSSPSSGSAPNQPNDSWR